MQELTILVVEQRLGLKERPDLADDKTPPPKGDGYGLNFVVTQRALAADLRLSGS